MRRHRGCCARRRSKGAHWEGGREGGLGAVEGGGCGRDKHLRRLAHVLVSGEVLNLLLAEQLDVEGFVCGSRHPRDV